MVAETNHTEKEDSSNSYVSKGREVLFSVIIETTQDNKLSTLLAEVNSIDDSALYFECRGLKFEVSIDIE